MKRILVAVITTSLIIIAMWGFSVKKAESLPLKVETVKPARKNIYDYINATGKVKEGNKRNIYVSTPGKISEIYVKEGEKVSVGDVLAEITPFSAEKYKGMIFDAGMEEITALLAEYGVDFDFHAEDITVIELNKAAAQILSPINGTITALNVKKGDIVSPVFRIMSLSDFNDLYVSANIPEEYSSKISEGDNVSISAAAFENKIYKGKIEALSPTARYTPSLTGAGETYIEATVSINSPSPYLRPGLNVNTKITADTKENVITLPYECILQDEKNREYVYCIVNGVAEKKYIITGYEMENEIEVKNGITSADVVIINPGNEIYENRYVMES